MVIRVTTQSVHGIQAVLSKHIIEAGNGVLLADSLDWIIDRQRGCDARLVAVGAEEISTAWANIKKGDQNAEKKTQQEY